MEKNMEETRVIIEPEELDLEGYEIVGSEFFAQMREPAFTVNVNKITANAACVRLMPDVDYVEILVNREEKKLVLKPCTEMEITGYRWARMKDGKRYPSQRTGEAFVLSLCKIMDWNPDNRYKVSGKQMLSNGQAIMVFDLLRAKCFEKPAPDENGKTARRTAIPVGWNGSFGPKYSENRRTLQVNNYDGYTVFSVSGKKAGATSATSAEEEKPGMESATGAGAGSQEESSPVDFSQKVASEGEQISLPIDAESMIPAEDAAAASSSTSPSATDDVQTPSAEDGEASTEASSASEGEKAAQEMPSSAEDETAAESPEVIHE